MRASTGNAVIDIATPMNSAKDVNGTSRSTSRGYSQSASAAPSRNGATMLACEIATRGVRRACAAAPGRARADQEHEQDDADLREHADQRRDRSAETRNPVTCGR